MTISQPSRPIYAVDVPEVRELHATYRYNFFTPDESVNETGGLPATILARKSGEVDEAFVQYSVTRAPRFVELRWSPPRLADVGGAVDDRVVAADSFRTTGEQGGSLILDNVGNVVSEDDFASNAYASVHFHDGEIDDKIHELVSGTFVAHTLEAPYDPNVSPYKAAQMFVSTLPEHIKPNLILKAMTLPKQSAGASYFLSPGASSGKAGAKGMAPPQLSTKYVNDFFESMKRVKTNAQINVKFMHDLVNRAIKDPTSTTANDMVNLHLFSRQARQAVDKRRQLGISEADYKTYVPYFWVKRYGSGPHAQKYGAEIVGFIIDKFEVMPDRTLRAHPPIVVDNPNVGLTVDYRVKFNARYCYAIRCVGLLTMPAVEDASGEVATIKALVSSKPSNKVYVSTLKLSPPPPPSDVGFTWNYRTNRLLVTWAFPVTPERDVKQFQVFKRASVDAPFELQKQYNFDDSVVPFQYNERPDPRLVERLSSPACFWTDDDFDWDVNTSKETGRIYAVCSIDAHGQTSGYSAQYRVWFDRHKNRLQKELVSHTGAPKSYPNMYLPGSLFENTIRVGGPHSRRMRLIFNPEFYYHTDDKGRTIRSIQTLQSGGGYRLQFMNVDSLKSAELNVLIDDMTSRGRLPAKPKVGLGVKRRPPRRRG